MYMKKSRSKKEIQYDNESNYISAKIKDGRF